MLRAFLHSFKSLLSRKSVSQPMARRATLRLEPLETRIAPVIDPMNPKGVVDLGYEAPANFMPAVGQVTGIHNVGPHVGESYSGTGILISNQWVLTAGHIVEASWEEDLKFILPNGETRSVVKRRALLDYIMKHTPDLDFGLLKLDRPIDDVKPMALDATPLRAGETTILVGYGLYGSGQTGVFETGPNKSPSGRRLGVVRIDDLDGNFATQTFQQGWSRASHGDSGGPLIRQVQLPGNSQYSYFISGIVSRGEDPGTYGQTEQYINVGTVLDDLYFLLSADSERKSGRYAAPDFLLRAEGGEDAEAPTIRGGPEGDIVVNADRGRWAYISFPEFTAVDNYDMNPLLTYTLPDGTAVSYGTLKEMPIPIGTTNIVVTATDVSGNRRTASFRVIVKPLLPTVEPQTYKLFAEETFTSFPGYGVLHGAHTPPPWLPLQAELVSNPAHGVLTLNADGSFTYTPDAGFAGIDTFSYLARTSLAASDPGLVTLRVDHPPIGNIDRYVVRNDQPFFVSAHHGVLANDTDRDGDPLTAVLVSGPWDGTLTLNADGSFRYTYILGPSSGGSDQFTYQVFDGTFPGSYVTVRLNVVIPPKATDDVYRSFGTDFLEVPAIRGVLANDPTGYGALSAALVSQPTYGRVTLNVDGSFVYTPFAESVRGQTDSFTYQVDNGEATSVPARVTIYSYNLVANPDRFTIDDPYNWKGWTRYGNLLANDSLLTEDRDVNRAGVYAVLVSGPARGSLTLERDGTFTYYRNGNLHDDEFTYRTTIDGIHFSKPTTVTLWSNQTPYVHEVRYTLAAGTGSLIVPASQGVLVDDNDVEGDPFVARLDPSTFSPGPRHGQLTLNPDGSFTYTPDIGFVGTDTFYYRASDGYGLSRNNAEVRIDVRYAPAARPDTFRLRNTTDGGQLWDLPRSILDNDSWDSTVTPWVQIVTEPVHGKLYNFDAYRGIFSYSATMGYFGSDSFSYVLTDGDITSAPSTVTLQLNRRPIAVADSYQVTLDQSLTVSAAADVLANDLDSDGDALTAELAGQPWWGTVTMNSDGSFTFTPKPGTSGIGEFYYYVRDPYDYGQTFGTVRVTVGTPPAPQSDFYWLGSGNTLFTNAANGVLANDGSHNGRSLSPLLVAGPTHGTLTFYQDGSFSYWASAGYVGVDTFSYQVIEVAELNWFRSEPVTVTLRAAPNATNDVYHTAFNTPLTVSSANGLLANDRAAGNPLDLQVVASGAPAAVSSNGSFTYSPPSGFIGSVTFSYFATENGHAGNLATVTVVVDAPPLGNPPPDGGVTPPTQNQPMKVRLIAQRGATRRLIAFVEYSDGRTRKLISPFQNSRYRHIAVNLWDANLDGELDSLRFTALRGGKRTARIVRL